MVSPLLFFALAFMLPPQQMNRIFLPLLIGTFLLAVIGVLVLAICVVTSSSLVRAYEILLALGPKEH